jgi:hypothetical protein
MHICTYSSYTTIMRRKLLLYGILALSLVVAVFSIGCVEEEPEMTGEVAPNVGEVNLTPHTDATYYFSLHKPAEWTITVGDDIVVHDPADRGITNVKIHPLILSGDYRWLTAEDIANYLVGGAIQEYEAFELESVRETADYSMVELVASFSDDGVDKKGVYTVFVESPYAMYTSYETSEENFAEMEGLLREIASSYEQNTPPDTSVESAPAQPTSTMGPLKETMLEGKVRMRIPDGWTVTVLPGCAGLIAQDTTNPARGVIFLNFLHSDTYDLPPGVTPEDYLTDYMPQDFNTVSDVQLLHYEDADVSFLATVASSEVKAMRASFKNQGIPAIGSFTIGTRQIAGYYTVVDYFWAVYAPADQFEVDAPILLEIFNSIDYSESILGECRRALEMSWGGSGRSGGSGTSGTTGDELREQRLKDWYEQQENEDIFMEEYSDYILNRDRVYNPETDEVYHVSQNFYQYYDIHREQYKQQQMVQLTNQQFRTHVPLDGGLHIDPN